MQGGRRSGFPAVLELVGLWLLLEAMCGCTAGFKGQTFMSVCPQGRTIEATSISAVATQGVKCLPARRHVHFKQRIT